MKNVLKGVCIGVGIICFLTAAMYLGLSWYYIGEFSYNTWINGIYCTGKSVNEVNEELKQGYTYDSLTILDNEGNRYSISADVIDYHFDFEESLERYKNLQNPYLWIDNLQGANGEKHILPVVHYDETALEKEVKALPFMKEADAMRTKVVEIRKTNSGYVLVNERENVLNQEKAREVIYAAVDQFEPEADLQKLDCYEDLPINEKMKQEIALWPKIQEFQDCKIVYKMGEELIPVDASVVCDWFLLDDAGNFIFDEQGNPVLDEEKPEMFITKLAEEYDTLGGPREFQATRGEVVTVTGGLYGNQLDQKAESAYLLQAFLEKREEIHTPEYIQKALYQGKDDIGDTYIEIDMTEQMMYYYVKGECVIETPVVTGNTSLRRGTPVGVNFVYAKQTNRILRGEDYASPVKFWIPVKGAVGIHDASWRSKYGGEIYKTNGSHGCINTPYDAVKELYELVEIGTPCIMFY